MRVFRWRIGRYIVVGSIVFVALQLVAWTIRPSPLFEWLRTAGFSETRPLAVVGDWTRGRRAPMTPMGFISLFPPGDLGLFLALVAVLAILVVLLSPRWKRLRIGAWLNQPLTSLRLPRIEIRVRTTMAAIALLGLYFGWEVVAWRTWRVRDRCRYLAAKYTSEEERARRSLEIVERQRPEFLAYLSRPDDSVTPAASAAFAAYRAYELDRFTRYLAYATESHAAYDRLKRKYEGAVADPSLLRAPDRPLPEPLDDEPWHWGYRNEYARALAGCDEVLRHYPDLCRAHYCRASILATCPDARFRDGRRALAAATRAAELSDWKHPDILATLAAAHAEAGDFVRAVLWQRRAMERLTGMSFDPEPKRVDWIGGLNLQTYWDQLSLYKSGMPYRTPQ